MITEHTIDDKTFEVEVLDRRTFEQLNISVPNIPNVITATRYYKSGKVKMTSRGGGVSFTSSQWAFIMDTCKDFA